MASNPVAIVESLAFLVVMLFIVKIVIDALEAAPIGFSTQADDYLEEAWSATSALWNGSSS